jgi:hypothetical protein
VDPSLTCHTLRSAKHNLLRTALCLQVLEGELAQRAEATRKLREVQKQLMLLGGLVPPSPVVTAAAAAAARGRRNSSNLASSAGGGSSCGGGLHEEAALMQEAKRLQDAIDGHTRSVKVRQRGACLWGLLMFGCTVCLRLR